MTATVGIKYTNDDKKFIKKLYETSPLEYKQNRICKSDERVTSDY
ncbi:MAG TPA: hypothetical protein VL854_00460 [Nitrososphaeraceae archaeon]|nr:hypothetical protein [Nitrososphaeraceae archaeon]